MTRGRRGRTASVNGPSVAAWVALAVLLTLFLSGAFLVRARESAPSEETVLPSWATSVAAAVAGFPLAAAVILGAPASTVGWWLLLGPVATGVLLAVGGTAATIGLRWPRWRRELTPEEQPIARVVVALSLASAVALPAVSAAVLVVSGELPLAAVLSLTAAYLLWGAGLTVTRRAASLQRDGHSGSA